MNQRRILQIGILVIAVLAAIKFIFLPLAGWKESMASKNTVLAKNLAKKSELWKNRDALTERLSEIDKSLEKVLDMFPVIKSEEAKKFQLKQQGLIENTVKMTGVRTKRVAWLPVTNPFLHKIPVKIRGEGYPQDFFKIINILETRNDFMTIDSIFLNQVGNRDYVDGELEISFYALDPGMVETGMESH